MKVTHRSSATIQVRISVILNVLPHSSSDSPTSSEYSRDIVRVEGSMSREIVLSSRERERERTLSVMRLSSSLLKLQCEASMEYAEGALGEGEEESSERMKS